MPVYRSPGVYIPEVEFTTKAIRGLPTNVFAFIGIAPRGDFEQVEPVKSYHQYLHQCSLPPLCTDNMSRAIEHFFYQGGMTLELFESRKQARLMPPFGLQDWIGEEPL